MPTVKEINGIVSALSDGKLHASCPSCGENFNLKEAGLFYLDDLTANARDVFRRMQEDLKERRRTLKEYREQGPERSRYGARSVNLGFIFERLTPVLDGFEFDRNDCRSLFDPIDYVIFEGLSKKGKVDRLFLVDIKFGRASLAQKQRVIRDLVEDKKIEWWTYER